MLHLGEELSNDLDNFLNLLAVKSKNLKENNENNSKCKLSIINNHCWVLTVGEGGVQLN